jgi:hypothetical protein
MTEMSKTDKVFAIATVVGIVLQLALYGSALALVIFVAHHFLVKFW